MAQSTSASGNSAKPYDIGPMPTSLGAGGVVFGASMDTDLTSRAWSITRQTDGHSVLDPWSLNAHPFGNDTFDNSEAESGDMDYPEPNEFINARYLPTDVGAEWIED